MESTEVMPDIRSFWKFVVLVSFGLNACGIGDSLEGCGVERIALDTESLAPADGVRVDLGTLAVPLPKGYMYRQQGAKLQLIVAPGIYCDSGDWGIIQDGFVQLQIHESVAASDPFVNFPETHRGHAREQIELGIGPFSYSFEQNALVWTVQAYFSDRHQPRVIFMYLRADMEPGSERKEVAIHYFPNEEEHVLPVLTSSIESALREGN